MLPLSPGNRHQRQAGEPQYSSPAQRLRASRPGFRATWSKAHAHLRLESHGPFTPTPSTPSSSHSLRARASPRVSSGALGDDRRGLASVRSGAHLCRPPHTIAASPRASHRGPPQATGRPECRKRSLCALQGQQREPPPRRSDRFTARVHRSQTAAVLLTAASEGAHPSHPLRCGNARTHPPACRSVHEAHTRASVRYFALPSARHTSSLTTSSLGLWAVGTSPASSVTA